MLIADEKLRNEAFDRRYERRLAFFQETAMIVRKILNAEVSNEELRNYTLKCMEARFLFDQPIDEFIDEIIHQINWWSNARAVVKIAQSREDQDKAKKSISDHERWFTNLAHPKTGLEGRFRPYLIQAPIKRPWLLRWP
jgi:hypothetical protein